MNSEAQQSYFNYFEEQFSSETKRRYKIALKEFFVFCEKDYNVVKPTDVQAWIAHLEEKGLKSNSIHLKLAALRSFYIYCIEENKVPNNPTQTIHTPQKGNSLLYYLTKIEVERLLEQTKNDVRKQIIVEMLYTTGLRNSELLNIKLADIKWDTRKISIRRGKGKEERFVFLTEGCAERLKIYLDLRKQDSEFCFPINGAKC